MMEFSSPLAAMHPPPVPAWVGHRDMPTSRLMYSSSQTLAPSTFNFRDLSMHRSTSQDYFSPRPSRGSSPTMSLAADLSSNCHIDQSPQIPTPRRSLFARDMFLPRMNKDFLVTPPIDFEGATTPPIPSSSPGIESMDISPLPHKAPCFVARVTLPSPSPEVTPEDEDMVSPASQSTIQTPSAALGPPPVIHFPIQSLQERKRPSLQRPSLIKNKMHSMTSVPQSTKESLLPAFQFGSVRSLTTSSTPTLVEAIDESPVPEQRPCSSHVQTQAVNRRPSLAMFARNNGSPLGGVSRKPILPRPRKQVRRSLSMFQHPDDVMGDREDYEHPVPSLSPAADIHTEYKHKLPHFKPGEPDDLPRIQQDTLINVLNGDYGCHYDKVLVVDCRFEYEYNGGHIDGAINYNDKDLMAEELFDGSISSKTLLIFHCEYSVHRAPRMAKFVRNRDRSVNAHQYPKLTYPEMYILDGGYSQFFKQYSTRCFPQNYVEMEHKDHEQACEKGMGKLKQRAKLGRAQTFAFGQHSCQMEDSPTSNIAGSRATARSMSSMEINDYSPMLARQYSRRLATY